MAETIEPTTEAEFYHIATKHEAADLRDTARKIRHNVCVLLANGQVPDDRDLAADVLAALQELVQCAMWVDDGAHVLETIREGAAMMKVWAADPRPDNPVRDAIERRESAEKGA